ncbi:thiamine-phosphate pyrophosphorylase [Bartonella bacilliformis str. Heidi Mejia]|uniref:Thiamine-phosphate pyrophosphorylase n=2 Tax=Bartonella bacilliformis TaxID=774 RepID=A1US07_BARBK|nr:thiamine phosphate synthase [Bartonella bacilliformis]ABM45287.1 thiamine-phosphate pyrophosphorylase [Bartonella bacilliformis KC583]AMG85597.1 thiamine phosphate synthase [Bartonella bacilliformis]EKS45009.1 thiamine-phosphate pyrophosphorylase [Bartonella bacilliformis INS]EYS90108.1 thiamine-phosphate pyrophosphorylase [Bartonella bacilliformis San Pedro600-02]EYS92272.1 thiamine-phosphate pyrophosphorylase [Bartonella bacilliformis str. Heidi Mejia]
MKLDPFYLIVDNADWIERCVPLGIKLVQLRIKNKDTELIRHHIKRAKNICDQFGAQFIVNDYWEIAIDEKCDFIHLGQEDLNNADIPAIRKNGIKFGLSTHDEYELDIALSFCPEYIALGPIYPTILKKMKWPPQGLEKIKQWKKLIGPLPLVGIGGLTPERAINVLQVGANSAAAITDIILHKKPKERVQQWIKVTQKWR